MTTEQTNPADRPARRPRRRVVLLAGVVVTLLLAAVVSFYASGSPDGLERVAADHGFADHGRSSATAGSPLADYGVEGVDNDRLSVGIAGVVGVLVVLGLGTGVGYALRRRRGTVNSE